MDHLDELKEEILVEEGNVNGQMYEAAMEEAHLYHTLEDYRALVKKYGGSFIKTLLEQMNAHRS